PSSVLVFIYIFWQNRKIREMANYLLGLSIPLILTAIYLVSIGVIKDFWYWTIVFNLTTYAKFGTSAPASVGFVTRILLVYFPSAFLLFSKDKKLNLTILIFLVGGLA